LPHQPATSTAASARLQQHHKFICYLSPWRSCFTGHLRQHNTIDSRRHRDTATKSKTSTQQQQLMHSNSNTLHYVCNADCVCSSSITRNNIHRLVDNVVGGFSAGLVLLHALLLISFLTATEFIIIICNNQSGDNILR